MTEEQKNTRTNLHKNKISKKLLIVCIVAFTVIVTLILTLILSFNRTVKYPDDFLGIYDTVTNQNLSIGDSRSKIESILGSPDDIGTYTVFYDNVFVTYDSNDKVEQISVSYHDFISDEVERFTYSNFLGSESVLTDFIDRYGKYVYHYSPDEYSQNISIFLKPTKDGYELLDENDLSSLFEKIVFRDDIYVVCVDYSDYTCIWGIDIQKLLTYDSNTIKPIES